MTHQPDEGEGNDRPDAGDAQGSTHRAISQSAHRVVRDLDGGVHPQIRSRGADIVQSEWRCTSRERHPGRTALLAHQRAGVSTAARRPPARNPPTGQRAALGRCRGRRRRRRPRRGARGSAPRASPPRRSGPWLGSISMPSSGRPPSPVARVTSVWSSAAAYPKVMTPVRTAVACSARGWLRRSLRGTSAGSPPSPLATSTTSRASIQPSPAMAATSRGLLAPPNPLAPKASMRSADTSSPDGDHGMAGEGHDALDPLVPRLGRAPTRRRRRGSRRGRRCSGPARWGARPPSNNGRPRPASRSQPPATTTDPGHPTPVIRPAPPPVPAPAPSLRGNLAANSPAPRRTRRPTAVAPAVGRLSTCHDRTRPPSSRTPSTSRSSACSAAGVGATGSSPTSATARRSFVRVFARILLGRKGRESTEAPRADRTRPAR